VARLPGPVVPDRQSFELADRDVVQERLCLHRDVSVGQHELGREPRPRKAGVDADVKRQIGELDAEEAGLLLPELCERHVERGIAANPSLEVQRRLSVPGEDEEPHEARGSGLPVAECPE
jgi:hypothetical protein